MPSSPCLPRRCTSLVFLPPLWKVPLSPLQSYSALLVFKMSAAPKFLPLPSALLSLPLDKRQFVLPRLGSDFTWGINSSRLGSVPILLLLCPSAWAWQCIGAWQIAVDNIVNIYVMFIVCQAESALLILTHLLHMTTLWRRSHYYPHFRGEQTEA